MFDLGWSELMLIAVLTVIVVGPRELPRVLRTVTQIIRKMRSMAGEFQSSIDEMAREAEIDDIKKKLNEQGGLKNQIGDVVDPGGEVSGAMKDLKTTVDSEKSRLNESTSQVEDATRTTPKPNIAPGNSVTPPAEPAGQAAPSAGQPAATSAPAAKNTAAKKASVAKSAPKAAKKSAAKKAASARKTVAKKSSAKKAAASTAGSSAAGSKT